MRLWHEEEMMWPNGADVVVFACQSPLESQVHTDKGWENDWHNPQWGVLVNDTALDDYSPTSGGSNQQWVGRFGVYAVSIDGFQQLRDAGSEGLFVEFLLQAFLVGFEDDPVDDGNLVQTVLNRRTFSGSERAFVQTMHDAGILNLKAELLRKTIQAGVLMRKTALTIPEVLRVPL